MSRTATETKSPTAVRLHNGKTFEFNSNVSIEMDEIPIIDVARMYSDSLEDRMALAEEVREASRRIGFFYVVNHDINVDLATGVLDQAKRFFALPTEDKMEVYTGKVPNEYVGYHPMEHYNRNQWKQKDLSEAFNWAYDPREDPDAVDNSEDSISIWPSALPGFRESLYAYHTSLLQFSRRLTRIFALALHLPEDAFDKYTAKPEAGMRILHYPIQEHSIDDQNGIGAHTDVESFTIVTQDDCGGLEVLSKSGAWIKAKPVPGSFIVNIADCFMRQTNDFFVSTVHRVINKSGRERYSAPFFFGFARDMMLEPLPTCISKDNPAKYPVISAGEYYAWRSQKLGPVLEDSEKN